MIKEELEFERVKKTPRWKVFMWVMFSFILMTGLVTFRKINPDFLNERDSTILTIALSVFLIVSSLYSSWWIAMYTGMKKNFMINIVKLCMWIMVLVIVPIIFLDAIDSKNVRSNILFWSEWSYSLQGVHYKINVIFYLSVTVLIILFISVLGFLITSRNDYKNNTMLSKSNWKSNIKLASPYYNRLKTIVRVAPNQIINFIILSLLLIIWFETPIQYYEVVKYAVIVDMGIYGLFIIIRWLNLVIIASNLSKQIGFVKDTNYKEVRKLKLTSIFNLLGIPMFILALYTLKKYENNPISITNEANIFDKLNEYMQDKQAEKRYESSFKETSFNKWGKPIFSHKKIVEKLRKIRILKREGVITKKEREVLEEEVINETE